MNSRQLQKASREEEVLQLISSSNQTYEEYIEMFHGLYNDICDKMHLKDRHRPGTANDKDVLFNVLPLLGGIAQTCVVLLIFSKRNSKNAIEYGWSKYRQYNGNYDDFLQQEGKNI
jgi:hypothetical protein